MKKVELRQAIVLKTDGTKISIDCLTENREKEQIFIIPEENDYHNAIRIEISGLENIARNTEKGYFVVPRCEESSDYALCLFDRHDRDFEQEFTRLNMPVFGIKTEKQSFLLIADGIKSTFKDENVVLKMLEYGGRPSYYFYSAFMGNGKNWIVYANLI